MREVRKKISPIRVLFIGESWQGSCARSLKEALARHPEICLDEVNEDLYIPRPRARILRAINRLLRSLYSCQLRQQIIARAETFRPDVIAVYKGSSTTADWIGQWQALATLRVNIYPDFSRMHMVMSTRRQLEAMIWSSRQSLFIRRFGRLSMATPTSVSVFPKVTTLTYICNKHRSEMPSLT